MRLYALTMVVVFLAAGALCAYAAWNVLAPGLFL